MGSKNDGFITDHVLSNCCKKRIRFELTSGGYSIEVWCPECGNYIFTGRTEGLIAFWLGDLDATKKNKGYIPEWVSNNLIDDLEDAMTSIGSIADAKLIEDVVSKYRKV